MRSTISGTGGTGRYPYYKQNYRNRLREIRISSSAIALILRPDTGDSLLPAIPTCCYRLDWGGAQNGAQFFAAEVILFQPQGQGGSPLPPLAMAIEPASGPKKFRAPLKCCRRISGRVSMCMPPFRNPLGRLTPGRLENRDKLPWAIGVPWPSLSTRSVLWTRSRRR